MNRQPVARKLWLGCRHCMKKAYRLTPAGSQETPRLAASHPVDGEEFIVHKHGDARMPHRRLRRSSPEEPFECAYILQCSCGKRWEPACADVASWWAEFAASPKRRDTKWLGDNRLCAVLNSMSYADRNCMGCPRDHARIMLRGSGLA
jgi:hypothetical protein